MGAVNGQDVRLAGREFLRTVEVIASSTDSCADAQPSLCVFGCVGVFQFFLNVFYGDQAFQIVLVIDDQQFLDAMLMQNIFRIFQRGADRDGNEVVFSHHLVDRDIEACLKAQVPVREYSDQLSVVGDRHAGNLVLAHDLEGIGNLFVRRHGDRVDDHAALGALYLIHFLRLLRDSEVSVDDPQAALLCHGNGHVRLGYGVHGCTDQRDIQTDVAGELSLRIRGCRDHIGAGRQEENVVKGERFRDGKMDHEFSRKLVSHSRELWQTIANCCRLEKGQAFPCLA